ncbi:MAG TPA: hypothetical protein VGJ74_19025 [Burkholderiales bacterium]|jgi:hypothetical protein
MDPASDEVLDLIGAIAMQRQAMEQDAGAAPARNEALRKLNALLARARHSADISAVMLEIAKVRNSPDPSAARAGYSRRNQQLALPNASRNFSRHKRGER